ncbi:acetylornithine deacetylase (ArgE) [Reichenbachiella sp. 5M10]|uniref:acetylornithine deacetylase n=1 Tax=Reichenbachiella sp. 5M10 TaxID=1889772 RepID=UPI000C15B283|nr:acetylornithine deacetylase [Reichenbachiella sp. 5M10]PIB34926.1 acetylornithine deacetylase (ArgE) [Reichenbachiella sp. 5M10]
MNVQDILTQLVSYPVLGGMSNLEIIHWIKNYIESHGVETYMVPNENGTKSSLHCRIGPAVDGGVILSGHTDVVPTEGQNWTTDPFVLIDKGDGKLYARGSCDMKGFVSCCLAMLPEMVKADLKKPIYFAFSYDEEIGCLAGPDLVAHITQTYVEKPKFAIIGEPSSMEPIVGQKGICVMETHVNGSAGHSSRIKQEVSAIHEAARLVIWLEEKMNDLIVNGHIDERFDPPHSSLHVGKIQGGIAPNIIADDVRFYWDVRVIPSDDVEEIISEFKAFCREREQEKRKLFPDFKIDILVDHPFVLPLDTAADTAVVDLIKRLTGNHELHTVSYAAEAGQYAKGGYESIICGPGSMDQGHRADEYIAKDQLKKCLDMLRKLILEHSN